MIDVRSSFDAQPQDLNTSPPSNPLRAPLAIGRSFILNHPLPQMVCLKLYFHLLCVCL